MSEKLSLGKKYQVKEVLGDSSVRDRLFELGLVTGQQFELVQKTTFGEPVVLRVKSSLVALRKKELQCIVVV